MAPFLRNAALLLGLLWGPATLAVPLTIDPAAYQGQWGIYGVLDFTTGRLSLDLPAGSYWVYIGPEYALQVTLDPTGAVAVDDPMLATPSNNLVLFNTVPVAVDPGTHNGLWTIGHVNDFTTGPANLVLVPGVVFPAYIGFAKAFDFYADDTGLVSVLSSGTAIGGQNSLVLQSPQSTIGVAVNTNGYSGRWMISGFTDLVSGSQTVPLVPGSYQLKVGSLGSVTLTVAANGTVTSSNTKAVSGGNQSVIFNTKDVAVNPGAFGGGWQVPDVLEYSFVPATVKVVAGLNFELGIGTNTAFRFSVSSAGKVSLSSSASASASGSQITFKTVAVDIAPSNGQTAWAISYVTGDATGARKVTLVPGLSYVLETAENQFGAFSLSSTGKPSPGTLPVGTTTFTLKKHIGPVPFQADGPRLRWWPWSQWICRHLHHRHGDKHFWRLPGR